VHLTTVIWFCLGGYKKKEDDTRPILELVFTNYYFAKCADFFFAGMPFFVCGGHFHGLLDE
jgi:hypothetical protein